MSKLNKVLLQLRSRVFTEMTFWNAAEYGILCGSDLKRLNFRGIPQNFQLFNSVEFRAISCTIFIDKFTQETLDFFVLKTEEEFKNIKS
jgi:hypothetical protein